MIVIITMVVASTLSAMFNIGQVELGHRDVFVFLHWISRSSPHVHHLVLGIAI